MPINKQIAEVEVRVTGAKKAQTVLQRVGARFKSFGKALLRSKLSWAALSVAVVAAVRDFADFEIKMVNVGNLTKATTDEVKSMSAALIQMSRTIPVSANELADALFQVQSAGIDASKSIKFLEQSAKLARAGLTDTKTAVDGLTSIINAYGLAADDASRISDIFFAAQVEGKTTIAELSNNIGRLAPIARASGLEVEELFAAVTTLTKGGIRTDEAVVGLRGAINSLIAPTTEASDLAEKLGINLSIAANQDGLIGVLRDIQEGTGGNIKLISTLIPNVRALTGVLSLAGEQYDDFVKVNKTLQDTLGDTDEAFKTTQRTVDAQIKLMKTSLSGFTKTVVGEIAALYNSILNTNAYAGLVDQVRIGEREITKFSKEEAEQKITDAEEAIEKEKALIIELEIEKDRQRSKKTKKEIDAKIKEREEHIKSEEWRLEYFKAISEKHDQIAEENKQKEIQRLKDIEIAKAKALEKEKQDKIKALKLDLAANEQNAEDVTAILTANEAERGTIIGDIIKKRLTAMIDAYVATEILNLQAKAPGTFGASLLGIAPILGAAAAAKGILAGLQFAQGGQFESRTTTSGQTAQTNEGRTIEQVKVTPIGRPEVQSNNMSANITIQFGSKELKTIATELKPYLDAKERRVF